MADITLGQLRDLWKRVSDWVAGSTADAPKITAADGGVATIGSKGDAPVTDPALSASEISLLKGVLKQLRGEGSGNLPVTLSGRNVQPIATILTTLPLAAYGQAGDTYTSPVQDFTQAPGAQQIALEIKAPTMTEISWYGMDGAGNPTELLRVCSRPDDPGVFLVAPFRPTTERGYWKLQNIGGVAQTYLRVTQLQWTSSVSMPIDQLTVLAHNLQIRDTSIHNWVNSRANMAKYVKMATAGGKTPIFVYSTLNQPVTVYVFLGSDAANNGITSFLGSIVVPASSSCVITNADFPGLDVPAGTLEVQFGCSVAPTTGAVYAYLNNNVGGAS